MSTTRSVPRPHRPTAVLRDEEARVKPLELFFDLVFVLALTQCTALMADNPSWTGVLQGLLILGTLWWSWVGYAWLTSVIDPDEGGVRITIFAAMAALLVASLAIPAVFESSGAWFVAAYAVVRVAHIVLFFLAAETDAKLRQSVTGLAISTAVGVTLLAVAASLDSDLEYAVWGLALFLDMIGPYFFGAEGWRLAPEHFAERHGLILIIALGESIVAIGVGLGSLELDAGVVLSAGLGIAVAAALWWLYFDVVALVAERRLHNAAPGRERNEIARDSYSYLHFPMIAGIVLMALGFKKTIGHVDDPLETVPAVAMLGGAALYLLAHVAFRWRNIHTVNVQRIVAGALCLALIPLGTEVDAIVLQGALCAVLVGLVVYERVRFAEKRAALRAKLGG